MYQSSTSSRGESPVSVIGAGIAGAWQALLFAKAGHEVTLFERSDAGMTQATSHWAGGMLAPYCEREASEPADHAALASARSICGATNFRIRRSTARWWCRTRATAPTIERFAKLTSGHRRLDADAVMRT